MKDTLEMARRVLATMEHEHQSASDAKARRHMREACRSALNVVRALETWPVEQLAKEEPKHEDDDDFPEGAF